MDICKNIKSLLKATLQLKLLDTENAEILVIHLDLAIEYQIAELKTANNKVKLKTCQYLILPDFRQNRQILCTPIFLCLRYVN